MPALMRRNVSREHIVQDRQTDRPDAVHRYAARQQILDKAKDRAGDKTHSNQDSAAHADGVRSNNGDLAGPGAARRLRPGFAVPPIDPLDRPP